MRSRLTRLLASLSLLCLGAGWLAGCAGDRYLHPKTGKALYEVMRLQARPTASEPQEMTGEDTAVVLENLRMQSRHGSNQTTAKPLMLQLDR